MRQPPRRTRIQAARALSVLGLSLLPTACNDVEIDGRSASDWFSDFDNPVVTVRSKASVALLGATPLPPGLADKVAERFDSPFRDVRQCAVKLAVESASTAEFQQILVDGLWGERIRAEQFDEVLKVLHATDPAFERSLIEAARTKPTVVRRAVANEQASSQLATETVVELIRRLARFHGEDQAVVRTIVPRIPAIGEPLQDLADFLVASLEHGANSPEVADALAAIGGERALALLIERADGDSPEPWLRGLTKLAASTPIDGEIRDTIVRIAISNLEDGETAGAAATLLATVTTVDDFGSDADLLSHWIGAAEASTRARREIVTALVRTLASDRSDAGLARFVDAVHLIEDTSTRSTFVREMQERFDEPATVAFYEVLRRDDRPREDLCDFLFSMWWPTTRLEGPRIDLRELLRDPMLPSRAQRCRQLLAREPSWMATLWNDDENDVEVLTGCLLGLADAVERSVRDEPGSEAVSEEMLIGRVEAALVSEHREQQKAGLRFAIDERPEVAVVRTSDPGVPEIQIVLLDSRSRQQIAEPTRDRALLVLATNPGQFEILLPEGWLEGPGSTRALSSDGVVLRPLTSLRELPEGTIALWRDARTADELPEALAEGATAPLDLELVLGAFRP